GETKPRGRDVTGSAGARGRPAAVVAAGYLVVCAAASWTVHAGIASRTVVSVVLGVATGAVVLFGVHRHRPAPRWPWWLLGLALAAFQASRNAPPVVADCGYLAIVFPATVAGLAGLGCRGRDGGRTLDALNVSAALAVLSWAVLIAPVLRTPHLSAAGTALGV